MAATAAKTAVPTPKTKKPAATATAPAVKLAPTVAQAKAPGAQMKALGAEAGKAAPKAPQVSPETSTAVGLLAADSKLLDEARIGLEELRKLNHDELRAVIKKRVDLLENVLKDREQRRAAMDTANMAGKLLDIRRERAVRIHKTVNAGSYWAAAATTLLLFVVMI
jgi:hypothetical protein